MPKKKSISNDEPLVSRPHRNMKAKVVFDPSDNYLPKRKNKKQLDKKKSPDSKLKQIPVNESLLIDNSSNDINTSSHVPVPSPPTSPVKSEIIEEKSNNCYICSTNTPKCIFLDCPICLIKTHKDCLFVYEPMWKFKLNSCPWICTNCRKKHCSKCLKDDCESKILCRCITCKVGLHMHCYESYDIKPMQFVESDYICIPCMTLATQKIPEVEDLANTRSANVSFVTSEEDEDLNYIEPCELPLGPQWGNYAKQLWVGRNEKVPDVKTWDKFEVYNYLSQRLHSKICTKILEHEIDGCSLLLIKRDDVTNKMDLTLGHALQLYKEIRILQTRSTFPGVYWE
ncbi:Zinc finger, RING/FYVE/PHD-type,Sterile alpha motif/pointed domain,Zinc finger, PHD-type, conserved [Cinara cedri]|uniref:Zinc finger, RING/FYVE/PHD-type,Sterile alpha motif/pointed domain,Zinc finger, PHD-type, conserved n=1 Tax=Cinara cedri TaxID=506608 RepID=A0A5E4NHJ3_9HEMI|nr:Zinc finger, RING/FYVE/PHD-type,Sterile alpha motif/pointed domain,Zinc finger, PHD-type, conserved [Cinara cedri]